MKVAMWTGVALVALAELVTAAPMRITEWMYNDTPEFVEFTNMGTSPVDMTGWSFDDSSRAAGSESLSGFGMVGPHESVIFCEGTAAAFKTEWGLGASVKVLGGNANNLSRADEINLYDNTNALVDRLTYDDQTIAGSIRTQNVSGNPLTVAALGINDVSHLGNVLQWTKSVVGDGYGSSSHTSNQNAAPVTQIGNPGAFALVPEPSSIVLLLMGVAGIAWRQRGRRIRAAGLPA